MCSAEEFKVRSLLEQAKFYWVNREEDQMYPEKARRAFDDADILVRSNTRNILDNFNIQILVLLAETGLLLQSRSQISARYTQLYFQYSPTTDQFYVRALLAQAEIQGQEVASSNLKGQEAIDQVRVAFKSILQAIEVIHRPENKQRYAFLVYNTSISAWRVLRPMLRSNFARNFVEPFEKISALLEEYDDFDIEWRIRYLQSLVVAYSDAERKPDAAKATDKIFDLLKKKNANISFYDTVIRMKVHVNKENAGSVSSLKKEMENIKGSDLKYFVSLQQIRSGGLPDNQVEKELLALLQSKPGSEGLAELSRAALLYNLVPLAKQALTALDSQRQPPLRARIWHEYSKAELLVKDASEVFDPKTHQKLTPLQQKSYELNARIEALKIIDKAMIANKRLNDPGVTTEGCVLIWNIGKPLLTSAHRAHVYRPFLTAASFLEAIDSPMHELRISLHAELARYELQENFLNNAEVGLSKAYALDASSLKPLQSSEEDPGEQQRPYEKNIFPLHKNLEIRKSVYDEPERLYEQAWADIDNARSLKSKAGKENILRKALDKLLEEEEVKMTEKPNMVPEEVQEQERNRQFQQIRELRMRHLVASDLASIALESGLLDIAEQASSFVTSAKWEQKEESLLASQANSHYILAHCYTSKILEAGFTIGLTDSQSDQVFMHLKEGVAIGLSINKPYLCFNGAAHMWNICLPVFKRDHFESLLCEPAVDVLKYICETLTALIDKQIMVNPVGSQSSFNRAVDFNYANKIEIACELAIAYCKINVQNAHYEDVIKLADSLLTKPIGPTYRKELETLKGSSIAIKPPQKTAGKTTDGPTTEAINLIEFVTHTSKDPAKKQACIDAMKKANTVLSGWSPSESNEEELCLHVELWTKFGNKIQELGDAKIALEAAKNAISYEKTGEPSNKRLFWSALAEYLYGGALLLIDPEEGVSLEDHRSEALQRYFNSAELGSAAGFNKIVKDAGKAMFNLSLKISGSFILIGPMSKVADILVSLKEATEPDFLLLFYKKLIESLTKAEMWAEGQRITDKAFTIVPLSHQRILWEAQMIFLSKQGKNVHNYLLRIKETDPYMRAMIWVKLARSSIDPAEIDASYSKAADILNGHAEMSEILIEWSTWLQSQNKDATSKLTLAAEILIDIEKENLDDGSSQVSRLSSISSITKREASKAPSVRSKLTSRDVVDSNPDKLNITHFDRLTRIYMMLGELSSNLTRKKNYLLKSLGFIKRILETCGYSAESGKEWQVPDSKIEELLSAEDRDSLCNFAFDKPKVTHALMRKLAEDLDTMYMCPVESALVLEYLRVYARVVLQNEVYSAIYASWRKRILISLGLSPDKAELNVDRSNQSQEVLKDLAKEFLSRGELDSAKPVVKASYETRAMYYRMTGKLKKSVDAFAQMLRKTSFDTLKYIPIVAEQLAKCKKYTEAANIAQESLQSLQSLQVPNETSKTQLILSMLLTKAYVAVLELNSFGIVPEQKAKLKIGISEALEEFINIAKMQGCNATNLIVYLKLVDLQIDRISRKLIYNLSKSNIGKRVETLNALKRVTKFCSNFCIDLLDISQGQGKILFAAFQLRIAILHIKLEEIDREKIKRAIYANVIEQYLDESERLIGQETSTIEGELEKAYKLLKEVEENLPEEHILYALAKTWLEHAKAMDNKELALVAHEKLHMSSIRTKGLLAVHYNIKFNDHIFEEQSEALFYDLAYLQHAQTKEFLVEEYMNLTPLLSLDKENIRLLRDFVSFPDYSAAKLAENALYRLLSHAPTVDQMKERTQPSTSYMIIHFTEDLSQTFTGFLHLDKDKVPNVWVRRKMNSPPEQQSLLQLIEQCQDLKATIFRAPFPSEEMKEELLQRWTERLNSVIANIEEQFAWIQELDPVINPEVPVEVIDEKSKRPPPKGKDGKPPPDLGPLPNSGITTLNLCVDHRVIDVPFESIPVFSKIPLVNVDYSMINSDYKVFKNPVLSKEPLKSLARTEDDWLVETAWHAPLLRRKNLWVMPHIL